MIEIEITLKDSAGNLATEAKVAEVLPAAFTIGRMIRFAAPDVPFTDDDIDEDEKELVGRVIVAFDPATSTFTVEIDDGDVEDGYEVTASDLRCPNGEHCCSVFAQSANDQPADGLGSHEHPLILPWPVDQDGDFYPPHDNGNPLIPRPGEPDCSILTVEVPEGQESVLLPLGARPLGALESTGTWGFTISRFDPESGAVGLSAVVPSGVEVSVAYAPCPIEEEEPEEES